MRLQQLFFIVAFLGLSTVLAKEVWQAKPYVKWTQQEAVALLTNSPWAVSRPIRAGDFSLDSSSSAQREGSDSSAETDKGTMQAGTDGTVAQAASASALSDQPRYYTVRFVSAQPIRKAIARWAILKGRIKAEQAEAMLKEDPYDGSVVVSLSASNDQDWSELNSFSTQTLKEETYLLLQHSKRKIFVERYVTPDESGIGEALFYFPKAAGETTLITPAEKEVTFHCRLSNRTQFRRGFKLEYMVVNGELAI